MFLSSGASFGNALPSSSIIYTCLMNYPLSQVPNKTKPLQLRNGFAEMSNLAKENLVNASSLL